MTTPKNELNKYLDPQGCPSNRPPLAIFTPATRALHRSIDDSIRQSGMPYLHPEEPTIQLDMLGSRHMEDWQERKVEWMMAGTKCWSELHQFYARYGVEATRALLEKVRALESAAGAMLTDCGMQAVALTFDILARKGGHAILMRAVYNKTKRYLEWLSGRLGFEVTLADDGDYEGIERAIRPETFALFVETYTNPLLRAVDPGRLGELVLEAREGGARTLQLIIDNTIATPWGVRQPLLDYPGVDIVIASGTKALGGQDRDLWGYIASNRLDFLNEAMDLEAMRGGSLDWRRAQAIVDGLDQARERFKQRSCSATVIAEFLGRHPRIETLYHPSSPDHPDREIIDAHYSLPGSLVSFTIANAAEQTARHFADVLAMCVIPRYAGSFDGLTTKVNHHRTVSEYFTPPEELERAGIDRIIRLGVGLEHHDDIIACLNWALWHFEEVTTEDVLAWQRQREKDLRLKEER